MTMHDCLLIKILKSVCMYILCYYDAFISLNKNMPHDWRTRAYILIRLFKKVVWLHESGRTWHLHILRHGLLYLFKLNIMAGLWKAGHGLSLHNNEICFNRLEDCFMVSIILLKIHRASLVQFTAEKKVPYYCIN